MACLRAPESILLCYDFIIFLCFRNYEKEIDNYIAALLYFHADLEFYPIVFLTVEILS